MPVDVPAFGVDVVPEELPLGEESEVPEPVPVPVAPLTVLPAAAELPVEVVPPVELAMQATVVAVELQPAVLVVPDTLAPVVGAVFLDGWPEPVAVSVTVRGGVDVGSMLSPPETGMRTVGVDPDPFGPRLSRLGPGRPVIGAGADGLAGRAGSELAASGIGVATGVLPRAIAAPAG